MANTMRGEPTVIEPAGGPVRELAALLLPPPSIDELRVLSKVRPYTMVGVPRLRTLYRLANRAIAQGVEGAFVECGTCNGGSGAVLAHGAAKATRRCGCSTRSKGRPSLPPEPA